MPIKLSLSQCAAAAGIGILPLMIMPTLPGLRFCLLLLTVEGNFSNAMAEAFKAAKGE